MMDLSEAYHQVSTLRQQLGKIAERDPDQEVTGIAVQTLDKVLEEARRLLPSHAVVQTMRDLISPGQIAEGKEIRAVDLLLVVNALFVALSGPYAE